MSQQKKEPEVKASNVIEWHSQIAADFDSKYHYKKSYRERYDILAKTIARYSNMNYRGFPRYYKHVKNVVTLDTISRKLKDCGLEMLESAYFAKTPLLSSILRKIGLSKYSDNLILFVARSAECQPQKL